MNCKNCDASFEVTERDRIYYAKIKVPEPTHCPACRTQRRFASRNERCLYPDECDLCSKKNISIYSPDKPFQVYCYDCWLSDKWDQLDYGRDFDFDRPFFEQYAELVEKVPRANLYEMFNENCNFTNYVGYSKNSYLVFGSIYVEDCLYGTPYESKNCVDSLLVREGELCYECIDSEKIYGCIYCQQCIDSYDLYFCYDCRGCKNCLGCSGLRQKEFCIFNQQYAREEYEKMKASYGFDGRSGLDDFQKRFEEFSLKFPRKAVHNPKSENCTGNFIVESENCQDCFDIKRCQDCSYCTQPTDAKDCYDVDYSEFPELCYEHIGYALNNSVRFCNTVGKCYEVYYSDFCTSCKYCFGCVGLQHKEYCILNKQYSREEYEEMLPKIIEHMKAPPAAGQTSPAAGQAGEWGEYFPIEISTFAYNETVAQEYFPMSREEVLAKNWKWKEKDAAEYKPQSCSVPDKILDVPDSLVNETLACEVTGKNFRIVPKELEFYRRMHLPIPLRHPDQRHRDRLAKRPSRRLWDRDCAKCGIVMKTVYLPDWPGKVYCEECYLKEVY